MQLPSYLLFDLGGVIINIDFERSMQAFYPLLLPEYQPQLQSWNDLAQRPFFHDYECGQIDTPTFYSHLKQYMRPGVSIEEIENAWMALLLDIPAGRVRLLQRLRTAGYRLMLLSNTNPAHIERIEAMFNRLHATSFYKLFDDLFFSYEIGYTKPDSQAFQYVLDKSKAQANDILFIDDSAANTEAAAQVGMHTYLVPQNQLDIAKFSAYEIQKS